MSKVRADIARQRDIEKDRPASQVALNARMKGVMVAQRRLCLREPDADFEVRQELISLAAVCEVIAAELPRPSRRTPAPQGEGGRTPDLRAEMLSVGVGPGHPRRR